MEVEKVLQAKNGVLHMVEELVSENVIRSSELRKYVNDALELTDPEEVRYEMEQWYRCSGIEVITGRKFELGECPFTKEEIQEAIDQDEMILCIPKGVSREELGKMFHIDSWALHDQLVTNVPEKEDFWFRTSMSLTPTDMKRTGIDIATSYEKEQKVQFSLERYIVFIARMRYLTHKTPDSEYWIWIPYGRYDRSGMLIAGYDRFGNFNAHGWMPQFSASFLGSRYGILPRKKC